MEHKHGYYMPRGGHDFEEWARNFLTELGAGKAAWGITDAEVEPLTQALAVLQQALLKSDSETASKEDIRAKNTALTNTQALFRHFVNSKINYNDKINADSRANLRVHVRDDIRTPIPAPTDHVRITLRPLDGHCLRLDFTGAATGKKSIPYGMNGVVAVWKVLAEGETPPLKGEELTESVLITGSPHVFEYTPDMAGKRIAFSAAWQNEKGQKGGFCDVETRVVP